MKKVKKVKISFDKITIAKLSRSSQLSINGGGIMKEENGSKTPPCELGISIYGECN